jgi:2-polyprenyl-3-methyl-5-hydroxy-6-metoxy-1,4-benzoquinol methylase
MPKMSARPLFSDDSCFVEQDPEVAGFYEIEGLDRFRWVKPKAVCRCRFDPNLANTSPCLIVRAHTRKAEWGPYLMVFLEGRLMGLKDVSQYGTYYFPFSQELLAQSSGNSLEVRIEVLSQPATAIGDSRDLALPIFEVRIIDLNRGGFAERDEFLLQRKLFEPGPGGLAAEILAHHPFHPTDRILDVGAGNGWTTVMLAGLSAATVLGIDLYDYSHLGRCSFKTELLERFDRHRSALLDVPTLASMADRFTLEKIVARCDFATVNAAQMPWRDEYFDFVFSLNVMEHVDEPERVVAEIRRVLRPGGQALIQFSPLYYSDSGSHLPATLGFNRPWAQLLMNREEIKESIRANGGVPFEVDNILNSLNGWKPSQFITLFEKSGLNTRNKTIDHGFTLPGVEQSSEFQILKGRYTEEELTTIGMLWHLEKPAATRSSKPVTNQTTLDGRHSAGLGKVQKLRYLFSEYFQRHDVSSPGAEPSRNSGAAFSDTRSERLDHARPSGLQLNGTVASEQATLSNQQAITLARQLLAASFLGEETLSLDYPPPIVRYLPDAAPIVEEVQKIVHVSGVKTEYVDTSMERYKHYVAAVLSLPRSARLLEIGAAPGHVSIAVKLAGYSAIGLNLNELWRQTYPGKEWLERLDVREHDVEKDPLPFETGSFDAVLFTEVLEHVAITNPLSIFREIHRVLKAGGILIFSTPNVCNLSNIYALLTGSNVFWPPEIFYGGLDRHNREYTPSEVRALLNQTGFSEIQLYGINDHNNWRSGGNEFAYAIVGALGDRHPLLRNTTVALALK